jgi:replication initiator protein
MPEELELSEEFFETLALHAVPLDHRALGALKHSALALDVYTWLAHRLCRIKKAEGIKLSWSNLRDQFGQEYRDPKNFKKEFRQALRQVLAVYPDARIEDAAGGLIMRPSKPPFPKAGVPIINHF